jgi:hypothetical protein
VKGPIARAVGFVLLALVVLIGTGWGALALHYLAPGPLGIRLVLPWIFAALGLGTVVAIAFPRFRWRLLLAFALGFVGALFVFFFTPASNDRDWQTNVAVLPTVEIDGDLVTVHNIRNFGYRTETDYTPAYYDRTFDLKELDRVDLIAVYWMGPAIAHIFMSFGFGEDHLAISIETRMEEGESYSTIAGFFRQFELFYVVADERDVIRLRTNYRKDPPEDVYIYRVTNNPENSRRFFLDYMRSVDDLNEQPTFYNTLTTNCTTVILAHTAVNEGHLPYSWKILLSGYTPEYAYEQGRIDTGLPFEELMKRSHVNAAAQAAGDAPDFSQRIRADLP